MANATGPTAPPNTSTAITTSLCPKSKQTEQNPHTSPPHPKKPISSPLFSSIRNSQPPSPSFTPAAVHTMSFPCPTRCRPHPAHRAPFASRANGTTPRANRQPQRMRERRAPHATSQAATPQGARRERRRTVPHEGGQPATKQHILVPPPVFTCVRSSIPVPGNT